MEKLVFGDLLTSELHCVDSYVTLVKKVVSYMHWVTETVLPRAPSLDYVAVADDDVYVRVDRILAHLRISTMPKSKLYAGYVWPEPSPLRDASHKNHVTEHEFPIGRFPPYPGGPFYIVSTDLARFVARNRHDLKQIGGDNDDASIGLWLLMMQVHPVHIEDIAIVRSMPCHQNILVVADILPSAIRALHRNEVENRAFCDEFQGLQVARKYRGIMLTNEPHDYSFDDTSGAPGGFTWELQYDATTNTVIIRVQVTVGTSVVDYSCKPYLEGCQHGLCIRGTTELQAKLYVSVDDTFCRFHRRALSKFLDETVAEDPNKIALLTLPRHNIKQRASEDVKVVVLSQGARYARVLIECLFVEMYPLATILVLSDGNGPHTADVFVFSALDGDLSTWSDEEVLAVRYAVDHDLWGGLAYQHTGPSRGLDLDRGDRRSSQKAVCSRCIHCVCREYRARPIGAATAIPKYPERLRAPPLLRVSVRSL